MGSQGAAEVRQPLRQVDQPEAAPGLQEPSRGGADVLQAAAELRPGHGHGLVLRGEAAAHGIVGRVADHIPEAPRREQLPDGPQVPLQDPEALPQAALGPGALHQGAGLGPELHRCVGEYAGEVGNIDALLAVGELAWNLYDGAAQSDLPEVLYAKDKGEAMTLLPNLIRPGAVILVKASRGMHFEEIVRELQRLS